MSIRVKDADDQNPVFSQDVYKASVSETAAITVSNTCATLTSTLQHNAPDDVDKDDDDTWYGNQWSSQSEYIPLE